MQSSTKRTVFIMVPPEFGHVNPISCIASELVQRNMHVVFYGNEQQREIVSLTGAEFRLYTNPNFATIEKRQLHEENRDLVYVIFGGLLQFSYDLVPAFLQDVERDRPDLIIYDPLFLPAKYLIKILRKRHKQPRSIEFMPNIIIDEEIMSSIPGMEEHSNIWSLLLMFFLFLRQVVFNLWFKVWIWHPLQLWFEKPEEMTIVGVMGELQPKRHTFDSNMYKFVGPCISERVRNFQLTCDAGLNTLLAQFKPKCERGDESIRLVYVSLGTAFNHNSAVYEKIIEACRLLDTTTTQVRVVVSMGDRTYDQFKAKLADDKNYQLPTNVYMFRNVPQLEVLKRASLFITHCGQNSISESIQYTVPIIGLPLAADQPLLAHLMCSKHQVGISLDTKKFTPNQLSTAIVTVLTDSKYSENMLKLTKVSQTYNGAVTAAQLVDDFLNDNNNNNNNNPTEDNKKSN